MARAIAAWVRNLRATRAIRMPLTPEQIEEKRRKRAAYERAQRQNPIAARAPGGRNRRFG